jgi:hypothetical protein
MSRTKIYALFSLGIASGLGIVWLIQQQRKEANYLRIWRKVLSNIHGAEKAQKLTDQVLQEHTTLVTESSMPDNPILRWHLKENILPGLALYRVLLQEYEGDKQAALVEVDAAMRAQTLIKSRRMLAPTMIFPAPFRLFKLVFPQVMKQYPAEGWDITYTEDSDEKVAFDITRCFYFDMLAALGAPELTASFCKTDDVMAECFPPAIRFVRPHTLGRGDSLCDFQYYRADHPSNG